MITAEAQEKLASGLSSLKVLLPDGYSVIYESFAEPDEDAVSFDGLFILVQKAEELDEFMPIASKWLHYNLGMSENAEKMTVEKLLREKPTDIYSPGSFTSIVRNGQELFIPSDGHLKHYYGGEVSFVKVL